MSARISVVIPTHARETRLAFALEALARQTLAGADFEVAVVRSAASPPPHAEAPEGLRVRFATSAVAGPAVQRNHGWRLVEAPLVAFIDDDCRPSPGWLEAVLEATEGDADLGATVLQGRTEPDPNERHLLFGLARSMEVTGPDETYPTCNIVYPRGLLERVGGFDESYPMAWGEDTDLGLRVRELGARMRYVDEALVWHAVHARPLPRALREATRREHVPKLLARHPEHRRLLKAGLFVNDAHAALLLAFVGAASAGRLRRGRKAAVAAATVPYLALALRHLRRTGPITPRRLARLTVHLPARALVDSMETIATVRGAIRHRAPVV